MSTRVNYKFMRLARQRQIDYIHNKHTPPAQPKKNLKTLIPIASIFKKTQYALFAGIIGLLLGGLLDLTISVLRTLSQPNTSAEFVWFLAYIFSAIGLFAGFFFGSRSGELFAQFFASKHDDDNSATGELMQLVAKILLGAALVWGGILLFA